MNEWDRVVDFLMVTGFGLVLWTMSLAHLGDPRLRAAPRPSGDRRL